VNWISHSEAELTKTLSEIVDRTNAKRRTVQFWADKGIIEPINKTNRAGTGVHRQYEDTEVIIVAMMVPLTKLQIPIGQVKTFAKYFRKSLKSKEPNTDRYSWDEDFKGAISRAISGEGNNYLVFIVDDTALKMSTMTDEGGPIEFDFPLWFDGYANPMTGVLDLNKCFQNISN
jgi:DNA-binding transcriptional MerR regulator